jgi:hypothetical protein
MPKVFYGAERFIHENHSFVLLYSLTVAIWSLFFLAAKAIVRRKNKNGGDNGNTGKSD